MVPWYYQMGNKTIHWTYMCSFWTHRLNIWLHLTVYLSSTFPVFPTIMPKWIGKFISHMAYLFIFSFYISIYAVFPTLQCYRYLKKVMFSSGIAMGCSESCIVRIFATVTYLPIINLIMIIINEDECEWILNKSSTYNIILPWYRTCIPKGTLAVWWRYFSYF